MRLPALSPRDRRALLLGVAVLVPALSWSLVVAPVRRALQGASARLGAERELLSREAGLLVVAERYRAAGDSGAARLLAAAPRLFGGGPSAAAAALAEYLQKGARESRVLLTHIEPLPVRPADTGLVALPLRIRGESDLEGVLTLLYALEGGGGGGGGGKLVRIEDLRIPAQGVASRFRGVGVAGGAVGVVTFEFTATGFMLEPPREARPAEGEGGEG